MARDLTQSALSNTTEIATSTKNANPIFEPLTSEVLACFRNEIEALKQKQDNSALDLCKAIFFSADIDEVDHANIVATDIVRLYHKFGRHFDRESSNVISNYLSFCDDAAKAIKRIEEKNYGKCCETGRNIPIDMLKKDYFISAIQ